jgi:hypothetical protein
VRLSRGNDEAYSKPMYVLREWSCWCPPPLASAKSKEPEEKGSLQLYDDLAHMCADAQICVDAIVHSSDRSFRDVSALAHVCRCVVRMSVLNVIKLISGPRSTGGDVHYFAGDISQGENLSACLVSQIMKAVTGAPDSRSLLVSAFHQLHDRVACKRGGSQASVQYRHSLRRIYQPRHT